MNVLRLRWRPDSDPPPPLGVVGVGAVARALRAKLDARPVEADAFEAAAVEAAAVDIAAVETVRAPTDPVAAGASPRAALPPLMVAAHADMLILTGPSDALPWVDGARYIAPRADAPALWLPTHARPDVPLDVLAIALARKLPPAQAQSSMLLWPDPAQLVPLHRALAASEAVLARIDAHWARG